MRLQVNITKINRLIWSFSFTIWENDNILLCYLVIYNSVQIPQTWGGKVSNNRGIVNPWVFVYRTNSSILQREPRCDPQAATWFTWAGLPMPTGPGIKTACPRRALQVQLKYNKKLWWVATARAVTSSIPAHNLKNKFYFLPHFPLQGSCSCLCVRPSSEGFKKRPQEDMEQGQQQAGWSRVQLHHQGEDFLRGKRWDFRNIRIS